MRALRLTSVAWSLAALVALGGCGSTASTPAASSPGSAGASSATASSAAAKPSAPAAASAKPSAAASAPASGLTHVKIGLTSKSTGGLYLYVGQDLGIFQAHGIDAEMVIGQSNALAPALVKGDLDFMGTIPPAIQAAERGLPVRGVFVAKDHPEYLLVGDVGVTQVSQLKGKQLAGSNPTQLPTLMMQQLLELDGLKPSDYTVIPLADDPARAATVANHQAAAGVLGLAEALPLLDQGHQVIDSTLSKIYSPSNGLAVTLTALDKRRDLVQRMIDASLEATNVAANDKTKATGVLTKEFGLSEANAGKLFDLMKSTYTQAGRPAPQSIKGQLEADAKAMELKEVAAPDQVYDFSLLPPAK